MTAGLSLVTVMVLGLFTGVSMVVDRGVVVVVDAENEPDRVVEVASVGDVVARPVVVVVGGAVVVGLATGTGSFEFDGGSPDVLTGTDCEDPESSVGATTAFPALRPSFATINPMRAKALSRP